MAIDLATLLQSVPGLADAPPPPQGWEKMVDPAVLQPAQGPQIAPEPAPLSNVSQESQANDEIVARGLEKLQHKGLFGVKGTLRDILGVLGDGLTGRPLYSQLRKQEKYGDILAGSYKNNEEENFVNNPLLALQRLSEAGYGQEAAELYQNYVKNEQAKQAALLNEARLTRQENRDDVMAAEGEVRRQKGIQDIAARTYGGIQDEETLRQFNARFAPILEKNGLGYIPLPKNLQEAKRWGVDTYRSNVLEDKDRSLDISQQNANTNAARPAPRPRSDTALEEYRRLSGIPEERRTPEQKAFMNKYTATGRGSQRRTGGDGSEGLPPRPGTYKGQTATSPSGSKFSWDGKSWKRQ